MRVTLTYAERAQLFQIQFITARIILLKLRVMEHNYVPNLKPVLANAIGVIKILFVCYSQPSYSRDSFLYICVSLVKLLYIKCQQLCSGLDCFLRQCLLSGYAELDRKNMLIPVYNSCQRYSCRLFNSYFICPQDYMKIVQL